MTCNQCDKIKVRIKSDKSNARGKIYIDGAHKTWYGRVCPDCHHGPSHEPTQLSHRPCRKCKGPMASTRYFECHVCKPELPSEDALDAYNFHNTSTLSAKRDR